MKQLGTLLTKNRGIMVKYPEFVKRRRQSDIDIFVHNSVQTLLIWVLPKYIDCTLICMNFFSDSIAQKEYLHKKVS